MRRVVSMAKTDALLQARYGFYFLYVIVSVLYVAVILAIPRPYRDIAREIAVFSDPAALGLFFMGAILLFERGERVHPSLSVSPASAGEYCFAKCVSLSAISAIAGVAIVLASGGRVSGWTILALLFGSSLFSLAGLAIGARARTVNSFMILTVPIELAMFLPAGLWYFGHGPDWMFAHPGVAVLNLLRATPRAPVASLFSLAAWCAAFALIAIPSVDRMLRSGDVGAGREA